MNRILLVVTVLVMTDAHHHGIFLALLLRNVGIALLLHPIAIALHDHVTVTLILFLLPHGTLHLNTEHQFGIEHHLGITLLLQRIVVAPAHHLLPNICTTELEDVLPWIWNLLRTRILPEGTVEAEAEPLRHLIEECTRARLLLATRMKSQCRLHHRLQRSDEHFPHQ